MDTRHDAVLICAGDIALAGSPGTVATAALLDTLPGTVVSLGDHVYDRGTPEEFATIYDPTWGRHRRRTRPVVGNHEYGTPDAAGYFAYFGAAAGAPGRGCYSFDLGAWHVVVLNSVPDEEGRFHAGPAQEAWLRADLLAQPDRPALACFHHPRFSSGLHGSDPAMMPLWAILCAHGVELVLGAHDHHYERFAPQDPDGNADPARGIRQFVVGTGGTTLRPVAAPVANSVACNDSDWGVLALTLRPDGYDWRFVPAAGGHFSDTGSAPCRARRVTAGAALNACW